MRAIAAVTLCALLACARGVRTGAGSQEEHLLGSGVEAVAYGGMPSASAAGVSFERTVTGAVRVRPPARVVERRDDAAVEAAVRARFAVDPVLASAALDVDVDGGVVRLAGVVGDPVEVGRAVRIALDTGGVREVESRLAWPAPRDVAAIRRSFRAAARREGGGGTR